MTNAEELLRLHEEAGRVDLSAPLDYGADKGAVDAFSDGKRIARFTTEEWAKKFQAALAQQPAPADAVERKRPVAWMKKAAEEICMQPSCPEGVEADEANFAGIIAKHCPALRPADSAPDGYVCVPREPTEAMYAAGQAVVWKGGARPWPIEVSVTTGTFGTIYCAMLSAAPREV